VIFFCAANLTVTAFINDRKDGFWNRTLLANVSLNEILISHTIFNSIAMFAQVTCCIILVNSYFSYVVILGSEFVVVLILVLTGYAGLFFGLMISCTFESIRETLYILIGKYVIMSLFSGKF